MDPRRALRGTCGPGHRCPGGSRPARPPPAASSVARSGPSATAPTARGYGPVDLVRACVALPGRLSGRDRQLTHPCRKDTDLLQAMKLIVSAVAAEERAP